MEEGLMSDAARTPRRSLESLKKEAKRWLSALESGHAEARQRFERAVPNAPAHPTLRDVQLALARENGFAGWAELKQAIESYREPKSMLLAEYEAMAATLLDAYKTGTPDAMERLYRITWHRRSWWALRDYLQLDLGKRPSSAGEDVEITLDDTRFLVAREHGFENWNELDTFASSALPKSKVAIRPVRVVVTGEQQHRQVIATSREWNEIARQLAANPLAHLDAEGQMTDEALDLISRVETVTGLELGGSKRLSDDGIRCLARLPQLKHLDLRDTGITDRGLTILRDLPSLETLSLAQTRITDDGVAELAHCRELRSVDLSFTHTGDRAIAALAGLPHLHTVRTGNVVSDAGIALLHELPVFKAWRGGEVRMGLTSYDATPNYLMLRGNFTDRGMTHMRGLDGLFALNIDESALTLTSAALEPLVSLPNFGWLAADAKDDWMPSIAAMPRLQFLGAQDTTAGDDGFVALSKSQSIEYIWGRRCHNLQTRGFAALANMRSLRALSVSCLNVDAAGVATLPTFPALRELMPMDIPDAGYRHIGKCRGLESLVLMYCRDTTDAATEHITGLTKLKDYFNSYTTITDRTPELLSTMDSLERITFSACHSLTDAGVAKLARLPGLREVDVSGRRVSPNVRNAFPPNVNVHYSP